MKITDVSVVVHERALPVGMPLPPMEMAVLRIHTDEGVEGNTFISPPGPNVTDQILKQVKPLLLGRDPLDIGAIWHELWARRRGMHSTVQGYIDVALWDIAGKAAGLPIHRLLGTVRQDRDDCVQRRQQPLGFAGLHRGQCIDDVHVID